MSQVIEPSEVRLTPYWKPLRYHAGQSRYFRSTARFNGCACGRRSGKTDIGKRRDVIKAMTYAGTAMDARVICGAPTRDQAKGIFWKDLKGLSPPEFVADISEGSLTIRYVNGVELQVIGLDVPQRAEGRPLIHAHLDEYADMHPHVWPNHVGPALADTGGTCDFTGVPEGRNHFYDLSLEAQADTSGEWAWHHWTSEEILPAAEIASMKRRMDAMTYRQEALATFETFTGRAYYSFTQALNCRTEVPYIASAELLLCFDFNVSPGVCAICQDVDGELRVIGEVYIPDNSNTVMVCNKIIQDWGGHQGQVICYGDATGGSRGSAKISGSDWDLIRDHLRPAFGNRLSFDVPKENPKERIRVNAVNAALLNAAGVPTLFVSRSKAPMVVKDFDGVRVVEGSSGDIDKKSSPKLTHISDAIGYMVVRRRRLFTGSSSQI